jgi:hypothetical protein
MLMLSTRAGGHPMTVKELIAKLRLMPQDIEVRWTSDDGCFELDYLKQRESCIDCDKPHVEI